LEGHTGPVVSAAFSPNGKKVVTASRKDKNFRVWNAETGKELLKLKEDYIVYSLDLIEVKYAFFSPEGKKVVTVQNEHTDRGFYLAIWDAETGKKLQGWCPAPGVSTGTVGVHLSADGKKLLTWPAHSSIGKIWDAETGKELLELAPDTVRDTISSLTLSADGKKVVVGTRSITHIFDAATGKELKTLKHPEDEETRRYQGELFFAMSLDGKKVITKNNPYTQDGSFRIWDAETGKELHNLGSHSGDIRFAFSPDGKMVVRIAGKTDIELTAVQLWDAETGKLLSTFGENEKMAAEQFFRTEFIAFSPDGKKVLSSVVLDRKRAITRVWLLPKGLVSGKPGVIQTPPPKEPEKKVAPPKPQPQSKPDPQPESQPAEQIRFGVQAAENNGDGMLVERVFPGYAGEKAGLKRGDVILAINGKAIKTEQEYSDAVDASGKTMLLMLRKAGARNVVTIGVELPVPQKP
jgi:WD40 repeat protein